MKKYLIACMLTAGFLMPGPELFSDEIEIVQKAYVYKSGVATYEKADVFVIAKKDVFHKIPKISFKKIEQSKSKDKVSHTDKPFSIEKPPPDITQKQTNKNIAFESVESIEQNLENPAITPQAFTKITIYFKIDSAHISESEKNKLNPIFIHGKGKRIETAGYTCPLGPLEWNQKLAQKRVDAVERLLTSKGIKVFNKKARGKCCYISLKENEYWKNRRVEIFVKKAHKITIGDSIPSFNEASPNKVKY